MIWVSIPPFIDYWLLIRYLLIDLLLLLEEAELESDGTLGVFQPSHIQTNGFSIVLSFCLSSLVFLFVLLFEVGLIIRSVW